MDVGPSAPSRVHVSSRSFAEFYRFALPQVYGFLLARCSDPAIAEDLCADAFVVAATQIGAGADVVNLGWLLGVARHKLIDFYRRRERLRRLLPAIAPEPFSLGIGSAAANTDREHALLAAMRALPDSQRAALLLRYQDDRSVAEVAAALDITVQATESLLARARSSLRRRLEAGGIDD